MCVRRLRPSCRRTDHRIRAVGTVSAVDIGRQYRLGADGTQGPSAYQRLLDSAAAARTAEAGGEGVQSFQLFRDSIEQARAVAGEHGADGFQYYCTPRAQHESGRRYLPWRSVDLIGTFDAFSAVYLIAQRPVLMVVGTRAVTAWMSVEAFQKAVGPTRVHWVEGASHVDLYDKNEHVTDAVTQLASFYQDHLAAREATPQ